MRLILIVLISIFCIAFAEEDNLVSKNDEIPPKIQKALGIKTITLKISTLDITKKYPAVVKDDLTLSQKVFSPVEGIVRKLVVKEGDKVRKGQIVAYIYSPEIAKITTQIEQAKVNYKTLKKMYEREKQLYENKLITYTRFYKAKINYENAKAKLKALEDSLKIYGEVRNGLLILRSKINGYIEKQNVVLGDSVDINKMLFKIHSHETLWTVAFVPVSDIGFIKKGINVEVISPIGKTYGVIDFISHRVDPQTKRLEVRVISNNKNEVLKPNMYVDVKIPLEKIKGVFVPASAVVMNKGKYFIFVKDGESSFKPVEVVIGRRINGYYQILSGVKEGKQVVVKGTVHLKAKFFGEAEE